VDALVPNNPAKRFKYVIDTYGKKYPAQVLDTFLILSDTAGVEPFDFFWSKKWGALRRTEKATGWARRFIHDAVDWLHDTSFHLTSEMNQRSDADPLWPWLARELVKIRKQNPGDGSLQAQDAATELLGKGTALAQWITAGFVRVTDPGDERLATIPLERDAIYHRSYYTIVENEMRQRAWQRGLRMRDVNMPRGRKLKTELNKLSLQEVYDGTRTPAFRWYQRHGEPPPPGKIVYTFDDGWTVQELPAECLTAEGEMMSHCVGGYQEEVESGASIIYSVRDPGGFPHVTIEYKPATNRFRQVFGEKNEPPTPEQQERVDAFADERNVYPHELMDGEIDRLRTWARNVATDRWENELSQSWVTFDGMPEEVDVGYPEAIEEVFPGSTWDDWGELGDNIEAEINEAANERWDELLGYLSKRRNDAINSAVNDALDDMEYLGTDDPYDYDFGSAVAQAFEDHEVGIMPGGDDVEEAIARAEYRTRKWS